MPWDSTRPRSDRYDAAHRRERRDRARVHQPWHPCSVCRLPLGPMRPDLHLDHGPRGFGYEGFAHAQCNVSKAAKVANAARKARKLGLPSTVMPPRPAKKTW